MEHTAPRISVVMPAYNTAAFIREALESVFAQDYPNYEVIVVNDGSPDTPQLERVIDHFRSRITYLKKDNGGVSSARNAGILASTGEYIAILDSDDLIEPHYMRVQMDYLLRHKDVDLVYGDGLVFGEGLTERLFSDTNPSNGAVTFEAAVSERCCIPTSSVMVRRSALLNVGLMDETLHRCEDFDLWLRVLKGGYRIGFHREVIFRYRCNSGGLSANTLSMCHHGSAVMEKMLQRSDLTPTERRAVENAKQRFKARASLHEGKVAFAAADFGTAVAKLKDANNVLHKRSLDLTVALLRIGPKVLWHVRRILS